MVSQAIHDLGIAKQSAEGVAAAAAAFRTRVSGGTIGPVRTINDLEETTRDRMIRRAYVSTAGVEGAPTMFPRPGMLGLLLYLALGDASSDATDPTAVEHEITNANLLPYFTAWRMLGDTLYERFVDCKIAQLVLTSEAGGPLSAQVTVQGKRPQKIDAALFATEAEAADVDDGRPFYHYDGEGAFMVEGVAVSTIRRVQVTINNNAARWQGDGLLAEDVVDGRLDISIETQQRVTDAALWNRYHYGTAAPTNGANVSPEVIELAGSGIDFKWTAVDATPGPERSARLEATRLQINSLAGYEPGTGTDPLVATVGYRVFSPDSGAGLTATVINGEATI